MGPRLFNIVTDELDNGTESSLSKFTEGPKQAGVAGLPDSCAIFQRGLDKLENGWWKHHAIQQEMQGPVCREEYLQAPVYPGGSPAGKQQIRKYPVVPSKFTILWFCELSINIVWFLFFFFTWRS